MSHSNKLIQGFALSSQNHQGKYFAIEMFGTKIMLVSNSQKSYVAKNLKNSEKNVINSEYV